MTSWQDVARAQWRAAWDARWADRLGLTAGLLAVLCGILLGPFGGGGAEAAALATVTLTSLTVLLLLLAWLAPVLGGVRGGPAPRWVAGTIAGAAALAGTFALVTAPFVYVSAQLAGRPRAVETTLAVMATFVVAALPAGAAAAAVAARPSRGGTRVRRLVAAALIAVLAGGPLLPRAAASWSAPGEGAAEPGQASFHLGFLGSGEQACTVAGDAAAAWPLAWLGAASPYVLVPDAATAAEQDDQRIALETGTGPCAAPVWPLGVLLHALLAALVGSVAVLLRLRMARGLRAGG